MDIDLLYIMIDFIKLIIKQQSYFISALKKKIHQYYIKAALFEN